MAALPKSRAQLAELGRIRAALEGVAAALAAERLVRRATGNLFLIRSLAALRAHGHPGRQRAVGSTPRNLPKALAEHRAILAARRRGDPALAEARMRQHVLRSLVTLGRCRRRPRPFPGQGA